MTTATAEKARRTEGIDGARGPLRSARRLTAEQSGLAADPAHIGLAEKIAAKFGGRCPMLADEFPGAARLAVVEAAATFDPTRGTSFRVYMKNRVFGACLDVMRASVPRGYGRKYMDGMPRIMSLDVQIPSAYDNGRHLARSAGIESRDDPPEWGDDYQDALDDLTRRLPLAERRVMLCLYGRAEMIRMKDVGRALGLSESRVSQIHSSALALLRLELGAAATESTL